MQNGKSISHEQFISALKYYSVYQEEPQYKILCPVHGDLNPSLQINKENDYWYCYGCGAHGSTLELVKAFEPDLTTMQAYKRISKFSKRGIIGGVKANLSNSSVENIHSVESKQLTYAEGIKLARDYYYNLPATNWYKVDEEVFQIKRYMLKRGFTTKSITKYEAKATYNKLYPIVFPLFDNGIFRGYVMRTDDPTVEGERKYMYNKGFKRRVTLPGTYRDETVVVVEGFLDMLKGKQIGIKNIVALLGWKITSEQIKKLKKAGIKKIICATDNDEAGRKGFRYLNRIAKENSFKIYRLHYPKSMKDMGDVSDKTKENILRQIHKLGGK